MTSNKAISLVPVLNGCSDTEGQIYEGIDHDAVS